MAVLHAPSLLSVAAHRLPAPHPPARCATCNQPATGRGYYLTFAGGCSLCPDAACRVCAATTGACTQCLGGLALRGGRCVAHVDPRDPPVVNKTGTFLLDIPPRIQYFEASPALGACMGSMGMRMGCAGMARALWLTCRRFPSTVQGVGYCGEQALQMLALSYGQWLPQHWMRKVVGDMKDGLRPGAMPGPRGARRACCPGAPASSSPAGRRHQQAGRRS